MLVLADVLQQIYKLNPENEQNIAIKVGQDSGQITGHVNSGTYS